MNEFISNFISYFAIPLWIAAGSCDWFCHRITYIESNSGWRESIIHWIMLIEMGIPILLSLFFEINALIFLVAIIMWIVHEATAFWDVSYAHTRRYLSPFEQHVHSFLELMPLLILSLLSARYWQQFLSLFGLGPQTADFSLHWKREPLSRAYLVSVLVCVVFLQILPYGEELWRCWRYDKKIKKTAVQASPP